MEISSVLIFLACVVFLYLIGRFFSVPLKILFRIIGSSIIGGCIIFVINLIGGTFGFHIGLNVVTTAVVGILGVPRYSTTYYVENIFIKLKRVE